MTIPKPPITVQSLLSWIYNTFGRVYVNLYIKSCFHFCQGRGFHLTYIKFKDFACILNVSAASIDFDKLIAEIKPDPPGQDFYSITY